MCRFRRYPTPISSLGISTQCRVGLPSEATMPRSIRFIPQDALVEVTCRTFQGRRFLRPTKETRETLLGVLGRAQRLYEVEIHAFVAASNHYHLLVSVRDAAQLANFVGYFNGNLARKVNRLIGWQGTFWAGRYKAILVSQEERAQLARLRYVLSHGVKENFVIRPADWPGVNTAEALSSGSMVVEGGRWFDGTRAYRARQRGESLDLDSLGEVETVQLSPLPSWKHSSAAAYRELMLELVENVENEARVRHRHDGTSPHGVQAVLRAAPQSRPKCLVRSPPPRFHTASRKMRRILRQAHSAFLASYQEASESLRRGSTCPCFPQGSFPSALAFVPFGS